ncbi:hypothetical protein H8L32_24170 [Undibacterium sp. CY18W]|uniref:Uncharacterized protein n=1 Tax=Undibacterium hunanense TaxID=2762292 RepID=A0ABR6ZXJ6_9BURK|nr:hypothetical protein [Undibacterium hunanense]MBC3920583.1 hypothetical protein [Undibacterium hunanense]
MGTELNFVNRSDDLNNSEIVIFQKNVATNYDEMPVAWMVIKNCGRGDHHPFYLSLGNYVAVNDSHGNYTSRLEIQNGQLVKMELSYSGDRLIRDGYSASVKQMQVLNNLPRGAINVHIYKNEKLLATKTSVAPQQKATFEFKPTIWIGVASEAEQGQVMNMAIISNINTELSLKDVASADIVMTGGGPDANSSPFVFSLENVVMQYNPAQGLPDGSDLT